MPRSVPLAAYDTLGVQPTDDFATIRRAWLRQVRENHPDLCEDKAAATRRLAALNDAWDALCWHRRLDADEAAALRRAEARRREPVRRHTPPASPAPQRDHAGQDKTALPGPALLRTPESVNPFGAAIAMFEPQGAPRVLRYC